jgi:adenylate cyclase
LIEAETGAHLWADRFDGSLEDVFDLQDKIAISVAGVIEPALQTAETARSVSRLTNNLTAYDLYLRAGQITSETAAPDRLAEAARLLDRAISRVPHFGPALAMAARTRVDMDAGSASDDPERARIEAIVLARRAVEAAPDDPITLAAAGFALGYFGEDIDAAITLADRALGLNPSYARGWHMNGLLHLYSGNLERAIEYLETSMRLNPRANTGVPLLGIGAALFFGRRFDLALPKLLAATQQMPSYMPPYRFLAACYAHLGRLGDSREIIGKLRGLKAVDEPRVTHWRKLEHQELSLDGLRLAAGDDS